MRNFGDGSMMAQRKTTKLTRREAADETTSPERLTALAEESHALARIVAKNRSAPVSICCALSVAAKTKRHAWVWLPTHVLHMTF